jgi:hypothetical protein
MLRNAILCALALVSFGAAVPVSAQDSVVRATPADDFARFVPRSDTVAPRLDFSYWDKALHWFVLRMGRSLRESEPQPDKLTGSHMIFGHDSRYRLEGNRVAFSVMTDDARRELTEYRRDLEQLPDSVPLTRLSRNEQLAYWINLHNVAMIEQIALAYPLSTPSRLRIGDALLDEAPFITVAGVHMSPRDIRTRIVYPNWHDPKVIYGFWHGDIGGPSISREAYDGSNVGQLLDEVAQEFVGSLRGTQRSGDTLLVSRLYLEAQPFYFADWPRDLRVHLLKYSSPEVTELINATQKVDARIEETDIADLSKGEREPNYSELVINGIQPGIGVDGAVARLLRERQDKLEEIYRRDGPRGEVIVGQGQGEVPKEPETVR